VGLKIYEVAGRTRPGQLHLKKVICEMGGKNAMIIDSDADLDEAIPRRCIPPSVIKGRSVRLCRGSLCWRKITIACWSG